MRWKPGRSAEWNVGQPAPSDDVPLAVVDNDTEPSSVKVIGNVKVSYTPRRELDAGPPPPTAPLRAASPSAGRPTHTSTPRALPVVVPPPTVPHAATPPAAPVRSDDQGRLASAVSPQQQAAVSGDETTTLTTTPPQQPVELASVWVTPEPDSGHPPSASEGSSSAATTAALAPPSRPSSPGSWASSSQQLVAAAAAPANSAAASPPTPCCQHTSQCVSAVVNTLTALSLTVSFGNVARLPHVAVYNGGVCFLVAYTIVMLVLGIPISFLEIGIGQFCNEGPLKLWRCVPLFRGVGYAKLFLCVLTSLYYSLIGAIALFYMVWSAKGPLPFSECVKTDYNETRNVPAEECLQSTFLTSVQIDPFWFGILSAYLVAFWMFSCMSICKSKQSYRVVASVAFLFIISVLAAVLFESIFRDTDITGLREFLDVNWNGLLDFKVWYMAVIQMFFSSHLGFASISTQAGIIYPKHSALWLSFLQILISLLVGLASVVVAVLWHGQLNVFDDSQSAEPAFPEIWFLTLGYSAVSNVISASEQTWAAFIFLAVMACGLISVCSFTVAVTVGVCGEIKKHFHWWHTVILTCLSICAIGVPSFLLNKLEVVHILDHYITGRVALALTALELIGLVWIYGSTNVYNDFEFLLGNRVNPLWKLMWYIIPVLLIGMEIASFVLLPLTGSSEANPDPIWIFCTGWSIYILVWIIIFTVAIHQVAIQVDYNLKQKICSTLKPSRNWGPADTLYRHQWLRWREWSSKPGQPKDFSLKRQGTKDYTHSVVRNGSSVHIRQMHKVTNGERTVMREPYKLETNNQDHVCWRGTVSNDAT